MRWARRFSIEEYPRSPRSACGPRNGGERTGMKSGLRVEGARVAARALWDPGLATGSALRLDSGDLGAPALRTCALRMRR